MVEFTQKLRLSRAREIFRRFLRHENALLIVVLVALIASMSIITHGLTTRVENIINVLLQSSIRGVASAGQAFVILTAGIDVSVGGIGVMCALLGAGLMTEDTYVNYIGHPVSLYLVIPLMLLVGAGWGAINGFSVSRLMMPPLIVTLAMWEITKGAGFIMSRGVYLAKQPRALAILGGSGTIAGLPLPVIIFAVVAAIGYFVLNHTSFGRSIYAVGGNPLSAWLSGIEVKRVRLTAYVVSGFLAGLAGVLMTARTMSASLQTLAGLELDTIAAVCVGGISLMGGKGSLIGAVIGVLIIGVINNAMSILGAGPGLQGTAKGAIIFSAVAVDFLRRR